MTACADSHRARIATALVLNNLGCTLLERRCAEQAYAAFHDAIQVAKHGASGGSGSVVPCHESEQSQCMMRMLNEAQHRFASSTPSSLALPCQSLQYNVSAPNLDPLLSHEPQDSCCRALRIDVTGSDDLGETPSEVLCAIILLNIANAIRSMAELEVGVGATGQGAKVDQVLMITNLVATIAHKHSSYDDTALFLSHVALETSIQALSEAGRAREASELRTRLDFLKEHVVTLLGFLAAPGRGPVAAAA